MPASLLITIIVLAVIVIFVFTAIGIYNGLQRKRIEAQTAWSDVDVQLKRRYDLIPNLVNTVKGYAAHEKGTFEAVIAARQQAIDAKGVAQQAQAENALTQTLGRLFALAEAYPDLKANQNYRELQAQLEGTENRITVARKRYVESVTVYNTAVRSFPTNLTAQYLLGLKVRETFSADEAAQKPPQVKF